MTGSDSVAARRTPFREVNSIRAIYQVGKLAVTRPILLGVMKVATLNGKMASVRYHVTLRIFGATGFFGRG